jgi:hypothetical protein
MAHNSTHRTIECKFGRICEHFHVLLYIGQLKTRHLKSAYCATLQTKKIKKVSFFWKKPQIQTHWIWAKKLLDSAGSGRHPLYP